MADVKLLVAGDEVRFELTETHTTIVWSFTLDQLLSEIERLEVQLQEKKNLLAECDALEAAQLQRHEEPGL